MLFHGKVMPSNGRVNPPQDHLHVYINMGDQDSILCPYCATVFRFDPKLAPLGADPPENLYLDP
jgi:hypothetical protein